MPVFICRWPNGDLSAVHARSRDAAAIMLDEVDDADYAELFAVKNFMVHLSLQKQITATGLIGIVPLEFEGFGESLQFLLAERAYPAYHEAHSHLEGVDPISESDLEKLNLAVEAERKRLLDSQREPKLSDDPQAAMLQERFGMPRAKAEMLSRRYKGT